MTPSVYQNISVQFDSQGADESSPKPQKRGPGRKRLPEGPKDAGGWRYRFKKDLLRKQDGCCADCRQKSKLTLHRINKNNDAPTISDYVLLCRNCIRGRSGQPRTGAGQRYRIRKALQEKLSRKYGRHYRCFGCLKRKKLQLFRINKNHNPPEESDYILLCSDCIRKKGEEGKKASRKWRRKYVKGAGSSQISFYNKIRKQVYGRDRYKCVFCEALGERKSCKILGLTSLIPESKGGKRCFDNFVTSCAFHRPGKGDKLPLNYIFEEISLKCYLSEQFEDEPVVKNPGARASVNMYLIAEISQYLHRIAAGVEIDRSKAERLCIKLSESDDDRRREREQLPW